MQATLPSSSSIDLVSSGLPLGLHQGFSALSLGSRGPDSGQSTPSYSHAPPQPTHLPPHHGHDSHQYQSQPQQSSSKRRAGVCKFFNSLKGFGFVVDQRSEELGGQEVFCHFSAISGKGGFRSLAEGEEVEYDLVQGPKGFQASNLTGPGGRSVVGDPKARLTKPQTFMPFAPLAMPLSPPYISDPYQQQHPGVYAASPYTQHVLYVPSSIHNATISIPPSQYAYTAIQHPGGHGSPGGNGPFQGQGYQPPSFGSTGFQSMSGTGPYQQHAHLNQRNPSAIAPSGYGGEKGGFGAYASQSMNGGGPSGHSSGPPNGHANGNGGMGLGAMSFAPFNSPPAFSNPALFSPPATFTQPSPPSPPYSLPARTSSTSSGGPSLTNGGGSGTPAGAGGFGSNGSAILFGSNPSAGAVGTPRSNASAGGTTPREERREERRGTPLGNGTITTGASNVFGPPVLYASGGDSSFA